MAQRLVPRPTLVTQLAARRSDRTAGRSKPCKSNSWSSPRRIRYTMFLGNIEDVGGAGAVGAAIAEGESAAAAHIKCIFRTFAMGRGDNKAILVIGNRHRAI